MSILSIRLILTASLLVTGSLEPETPNVIHTISERAFYFGAGTALASVSLAARFGGTVCKLTPWTSHLSKECLLLSHICGSASKHIFTKLLRGFPSSPLFLSLAPLSQSSWQLNQSLLSQVPSFSNEDQRLLQFLENRWLSKSTGFYPFLINRVCPCFGIYIQVHPETTSSYARDPWNKCSQTYTNRVEQWKQTLPHPFHFPLILTRPHDIKDYIPSYLCVEEGEKTDAIVERAKKKQLEGNQRVVVDLTDWENDQDAFSGADGLICIHRVLNDEVGGIRILPSKGLSADEIEEQHQYLLKWISKFGISANRVELDRCSFGSNEAVPRVGSSFASQSKKEILSFIHGLEERAGSVDPQKALMRDGTLNVIKGLLNHITDDKWDELASSPTRFSVVQLSLIEIAKLFEVLDNEIATSNFYETAAQLEQIHSHLSTLLVVFEPFSTSDFPQIYQDLLSSVPTKLKALTSYAIHSTGMTSLTGIFKAVETALGNAPRVLYGENTYFENIMTSEMISHATSIEDATEEDWKEVDLILGQFNPILKRIDFEVSEYRVEKVAQSLHRALRARETKPLTLALDCTLDYIDSPKVEELLNEFQDEVERGELNIICYRSGLKFDLFGMDNYCGAPLYMLHNTDAKWAAFDRLLTDPVLQTDRLSLNWFCLAYQNAAPQLEGYRKQIFDNTRALLDKVPTRLLNNKNSGYRIVPVDADADLAFLDIKIYGPLHEMKGGLIGGFLTLKCMEEHHPLFYRPSLGFYHPNLSILFSEKCTTIRLTLGLDPTQVDILAACFESMDALNEVK